MGPHMAKRQKTFGILTLWVALGTAGCARSPTPTATLVQAPAPSWKVGSSYSYALDLDSEAKLTGKDSLLDFALHADLRVTPLRNQGDVTELALELGGARFTSHRPDTAQAFDKLAAELQTPFLVTFVSGKLSGLRQKPELSVFAASIERSIMAALQFTPRAGAGPTWTAEELDGTGKFTAEYGPSSQGRVQKKKLRYAPVAASRLASANPLSGGGNVDPTPQIESSDGALWLEPSGRLARLEQHEALTVSLLGSTPVHSRTNLKLAFGQELPAAATTDWEALRAASVAVPVTRPPSGSNDTDLGLDRAKIGDLTFERALAELESAERDDKQRRINGEAPGGPPDDSERVELEAFGREQARVFTGLSALMRSEPRTVTQAMAAIKRGSVADKAMLDALAASQAAAAEAALVELAKNPKLSEELRSKAAASLIRVRKPSDVGVQALESLLDDPLLGVYAVYGLGTFARRLRETGDFTRSDAASRLLLTRLAKVTGDSDKASVLRGIANSAYLGALPSVRPFLTSSNASLRLAAVQALRLMDHPDVPGLLAERLDNDTASKVRIAALDAASKRSGTQVLERAVEHIAQAAPDAQSRLNAVSLLEHWSHEHPQLRDSLALVAKTEKEPQIRELARGAAGL